MDKNNIVINKVETIKTVQEFSLHLDRQELIDLVNRKGYEIFIPLNARVYFLVPSGADWSGTDIDIDKDNPIRFYWTEVTQKINNG